MVPAMCLNEKWMEVPTERCEDELKVLDQQEYGMRSEVGRSQVFFDMEECAR